MDDIPPSDEELELIEARIRAASPAPWQSWIEGRDHFGGSDVVSTGNGEFYISLQTFREDRPTVVNPHLTIADQDFVAHARKDLPRLLAEVRRLRRLLTDQSHA